VVLCGGCGGRTALQVTLGELGINYINSRPHHPQTCGKVERFHHTLKKRLAALPPARSLTELQTQLDEFSTYYNTIRPHRALNRRTPLPAFKSHPKAFPHRLPHPTAPPGPPRPHRRRRRHHPALQQPTAPHRTVQAPHRHQSHRAHRRPRHPRARPQHRNTAPQTRLRPHLRLPTPRRQMRKLSPENRL
jgi:Integrase core domain